MHLTLNMGKIMSEEIKTNIDPRLEHKITELYEELRSEVPTYNMSDVKLLLKFLRKKEKMLRETYINRWNK